MTPDPRPDELTQDQQGDESPFLNQLEKQKFRGHDDDNRPGERSDRNVFRSLDGQIFDVTLVICTTRNPSYFNQIPVGVLI